MKILLNEKELNRTIDEMAAAILKVHLPFSEIILVGIQTRGVILAERLKKRLLKKSKGDIPLGVLDINLYRDDLSTIAPTPIVKKTEIPCLVEGQGILLVDDVLYTGRTIRAALDALIDLGRPRFIELAALIDRGGRELPIQANYVGMRYPARSNENVKVMFQETDQAEKVIVVHGTV
jgi:pyrimidine operon attenuation protein/uracil phosphoribosyltransferase